MEECILCWFSNGDLCLWFTNGDLCLWFERGRLLSVVWLLGFIPRNSDLCLWLDRWRLLPVVWKRATSACGLIVGLSREMATSAYGWINDDFCLWFNCWVLSREMTTSVGGLIDGDFCQNMGCYPFKGLINGFLPLQWYDYGFYPFSGMIMGFTPSVVWLMGLTLTVIRSISSDNIPNEDCWVFVLRCRSISHLTCLVLSHRVHLPYTIILSFKFNIFIHSCILAYSSYIQHHSYMIALATQSPVWSYPFCSDLTYLCVKRVACRLFRYLYVKRISCKPLLSPVRQVNSLPPSLVTCVSSEWLANHLLLPMCQANSLQTYFVTCGSSE